jgi:hypothetical protein
MRPRGLFKWDATTLTLEIAWLSAACVAAGRDTTAAAKTRKSRRNDRGAIIFLLRIEFSLS